MAAATCGHRRAHGYWHVVARALLAEKWPHFGRAFVQCAYLRRSVSASCCRGSWRRCGLLAHENVENYRSSFFLLVSHSQFTSIPKTILTVRQLLKILIHFTNITQSRSREPFHV